MAESLRILHKYFAISPWCICFPLSVLSVEGFLFCWANVRMSREHQFDTKGVIVAIDHLGAKLLHVVHSILFNVF